MGVSVWFPSTVSFETKRPLWPLPLPWTDFGKASLAGGMFLVRACVAVAFIVFVIGTTAFCTFGSRFLGIGREEASLFVWQAAFARLGICFPRLSRA